MPRSIPRPLVRANQAFLLLSVLLAALLHTPWLLLITLVVAAGGLLLGPKGNLIMRLARPVLQRYINLKEAAQEDAEQQRFNQTLAVSMLVLSQIGFYGLNSAVFGWIFAAMVAAAAGVAILGFCVGCWIHYRLHMFLARRAQAHRA